MESVLIDIVLALVALHDLVAELRNTLGQGIAVVSRAANRLGSVEDLADATLLLVSEKSRWITAQFISVSGGITGTM